MTKENLVTGPSNISKEDAHGLLAKHKVEKLPLVDEEGHLTGLITVKDFVKTEQYPDATKDEQGRLRVAAGVGFLGDAWQPCLRSDGSRRGRARGRHRQR